MKPDIRVKRIYESKAADDGCRVLVDRIWPRGLTREAAAIDHWFKELGPSTALRKWFGHRPERWAEFAQRYRAELQDAARQALLQQLTALAAAGPLTLLYSARDEDHNQAVVMAQVLRAKLTRSKR
jgi:uncharacterized protein YeaO (DUF488 family)